MNYQYLNFLFSEKCKADNKVEEIAAEERSNTPLCAETAEHFIELRTTKKTFWIAIAQGYELSIKEYLKLHPIK